MQAKGHSAFHHPYGSSQKTRSNTGCCRFIRQRGKKREKKGKKGKKEKRGERAEAGGGAQNSTDEDQNYSGEEEEQPMTVERRIFRRHKTRKLRKLNNGGKLVIVPIKT